MQDTPIEFINFLKSQHKAIITTVYEIDTQEGHPFNLNNSIEKLNKITDILFDHLEKEDKQLYPTLLSHKETLTLARKYSYDMERLSCITLDFFKRYCINREGLKIFAEDFISAYSTFKGLLTVRIKREETELYPAYVLLQSGVLYSEVVDFVKEQEAEAKNKQKTVFLYSENKVNMSALSLALEISGYQVESTDSANRLLDLLKKSPSDLILLDVTKSTKELSDLIYGLKNDIHCNPSLVGYSTSEMQKPDENLNEQLDSFISRPTMDIENFSNQIKILLNK